VVMVSRYDRRTKKVEEITVNSCLTLLCSLDGCAVTTTEGLGNQQTGHHAIHKRMSGFHASQCGFCTPGMTMALYGALRSSVAKSCHKAEANGAACNLPLTAAEAERAIAGNICRCTGYRPLLDTCKSFCANVDVEDLGLRQFPDQNELPAYDSSRDPAFPPFLIAECDARDIHSHHYGNIESVLSMVLSSHLCHNPFQQLQCAEFSISLDA
jgi:indole-3-acetaldehyde oxidase